MLNQRQVQIMEHLEHSKASGLELAKITGTSKRTVLRDISQINYLLGETGEVISNPLGGYQLHIRDKQAYMNLLHQSMYDDELILLELLCHDFRTLDDLAATLYVSKPTLSEKIVFLRSHYANRLAIKSKPNYGHYLDETITRKLILLANLIDKNPAFFCNRLGIAMADYNALLQTVRAMEISEYYPNIHSAHFVSLLLAAQVLGDETGEVASFFRVFEIGEEACALLTTFTSMQKQKDALVTLEQVQQMLQQLAEHYNASVYDLELVEQLTAHLKRSIAYPIILHDRKLHNIANIKAVYPLAFDLSIAFVARANEQFGMELYDIDLIGLYFSCAMERMKQPASKVLLFSDQYAVASINKQMIEKELPAIELILVMQRQELKSALEQHDIKLILNNAPFQEVNSDVTQISIKQVITKAELQTIQDTLEKIDVHKNIKTYFPEALAMSYQNKPTDNWDTVIAGICKQLEANGTLSEEEVIKIKEREQKGDNLVINHLAVPHCTTQRNQAFFAVFVHLIHPVEVDGTLVQNVLVACVNPNVSTELKVFSYLYYVLNEHEEEVILGIEDYASFIACIEK
ncbi:PTS sugar transporter subunit IIA [Listeria booriae]|uniref:PTS sugar transporter subunit IIA n=1 Tax=Listeria booriae TaxID=1552123 RepID=UPI00162926B8|nr:PTS sugar transporter subunit IIA [Listeria booriae]MBC1513505.1 PTS transporter subunit EIIA [Listeria booriae]MBC6152334.1 PTS transporter subunit EIIA [Listeria booriae]MBC6307171.1 PTS transporter subunit EIIA [Listeria booriae]